jgi:hypothetical protein
MAAGMIAAAAVVTIVAGMTETVTTTDMIVGTIGAVITVTPDVRLHLVVTPLAEGAIHVVLAQVRLALKAVIPRPLAGNVIKVLPMRMQAQKNVKRMGRMGCSKGANCGSKRFSSSNSLRYGFQCSCQRQNDEDSLCKKIMTMLHVAFKPCFNPLH